MKTILIVEDDALTRENLGTILEMEGYQTVTAPDGRAGVESALASPPDLVLCDVSMPVMDGHATLRELRADPRTADVPFIFLTARGERRDLRDGMNLGADDYLVKPVEAEDLLAAIESRLTRLAARGGADAGADFSASTPLEELGLTVREAQVLLWVAQGKANADVAAILSMSEKTVKIHLGHIFEKLGVETRTAAALRAIETLPRLKKPQPESRG
jgi:DNA-binding NarL/FixJ family response regulator